jgi:hypothetical protein
MQHRAQRNSACPRSGNPTVITIEARIHEPEADPPAAFATDAEIQIAERLRRQLELRYLSESEASPSLAVAANDDGEEPL